MTIKIESGLIDDMKVLIQSGDLILDERRAAYEAMTGENPNMDDAALIAAIALTDDDDDDLFVENVIRVKVEGYEITENLTAA